MTETGFTEQFQASQGQGLHRYHSVKSLKPDPSNDTTYLLSYWSIPLKLELMIETVGSCNKNALNTDGHTFCHRWNRFYFPPIQQLTQQQCLPFQFQFFFSLYGTQRLCLYWPRCLTNRRYWTLSSLPGSLKEKAPLQCGSIYTEPRQVQDYLLLLHLPAPPHHHQGPVV